MVVFPSSKKTGLYLYTQCCFTFDINGQGNSVIKVNCNLSVLQAIDLHYHPTTQNPTYITRSLRALITTSTPEESTGSTPCLLALTCCPKNNKVLLTLQSQPLTTKQTRFGLSITNYEISKPFYKHYLALVVSQLHCLQEVLYPLTEIFFSAFCSKESVKTLQTDQILHVHVN